MKGQMKGQIIILALMPALWGCANAKSLLGIEKSDAILPIADPFGGYSVENHPQNPPVIVVRGKKGSEEEADTSEEGDYKDHAPTLSDRQIAGSLSSPSSEEEGRREEIEKGLYLKSSGDPLVADKSVSYLARVDHIKQLYRNARFEAALLETDELLREYQFDSKIHEMRGTLLDRLGRKELALKSWNQALRLDPRNESLKRFIARKQWVQSNQGTAQNQNPVQPAPLTADSIGTGGSTTP